MFSVRVGQAGQASVFVLCGELDYESAVQLQEAADRMLTGEGGPNVVVIDCAGLDFCDSSGINCLVRMYQSLSAHGGVLRMAAMPAPVTRIFTLTGLDQAIAVHATVHEALAAGSGVRQSRGEDAPSSLRSASGR
ncbi:STAS domain-containing protein [Streptomyces bungoensis]|uniref:STAS domain-containing protein n=1 Tax=Streptomyces bungoensis TaxID=285568 RepID=UPI000A4D4857|nr:STAS domain-containing protein [Streptomyces bungoensis]